jgi:endonuclease/exonuclease/phosphatase family metal-dependent hydrolase
MHHGNVTKRIAKGLLALRRRIEAAKIPPSALDQSINVAIWNVRELGKVRREQASIHYLAEILGQFDLVALVELRDGLEDLGRVLPILGPSWDVVYSDWMADAGGNRERTAFLYDRRAVAFNGLAAEVDAPRSKRGDEYLASRSFWRAPYMCSFRSGNFDFVAIAAHARWGNDPAGRRAELAMLAEWIDARFEGRYAEDRDLIVMGDFNTPKIGDDVFAALASRGLMVPNALRELKAGNKAIGGSNLNKDMRYDQILHLPTMKDRFSDRGGVLDFYIDDDHIKELYPGKGYDARRFSFQLSDHFPVWIQVRTDIDGQRLEQVVQNGRG